MMMIKKILGILLNAFQKYLRFYKYIKKMIKKSYDQIDW